LAGAAAKTANIVKIAREKTRIIEILGEGSPSTYNSTDRLMIQINPDSGRTRPHQS
jgi:hypothetical protein